MRLCLRHGNVLDTRADALVVSFDGESRKMRGAVASQCSRKWNETWEEIESSFDFPVPLGRAASVLVSEVTDDPFPFKVVFCVSILDHLNRANEKTMPGVVRSALREVLDQSQALRLGTIGTTLMKGGWRMNASRAFDAMVTVVDEFSSCDAELWLYSFLETDHQYLMGLAQSYGLLK